MQIHRGITRRDFVASTAVTVAAAASQPAWSQAAFPSDTIRIILALPAGGTLDATSRMLAQRMNESWGRPVVVDNRPGANGALAAQAVAKALPDGHTLLMTISAVLAQTVVNSRPGYKLSDLAPVSWLCDIPICIAVRRSLGVETLNDLVRMARSSPGKLTYATSGAGSSPNFVGELFKSETRTSIVHIPYKGDGPATMGVVAGDVDLVLGSLGNLSQFPEKIKVLATASATRFPSFPDVPTFRELGFQGVDMPAWSGLFAPAGVPAPVIERVAAEVERIVKLPEVSRKLLEFGFLPLANRADKFVPMMEDNLAKLKKIVAEGRVQVG